MKMAQSLFHSMYGRHNKPGMLFAMSAKTCFQKRNSKNEIAQIAQIAQKEAYNWGFQTLEG